MCAIADESLRVSVLTTLATDSRVACADLRVGVLNGIAHLAGTVETLAQRNAAEDLAGHTPGVRGVVNRIQAPGAPSPARSVDLTESGGTLDEG
mgnify:FL=1